MNNKKILTSVRIFFWLASRLVPRPVPRSFNEGGSFSEGGSFPVRHSLGDGGSEGWSGIRESNPRLLLGKQVYCHCTNPAFLPLVNLSIGGYHSGQMIL